MNQHERYLFDVQGYVVVPHAIAPHHVQVLNELLNQHIALCNGGDRPWLRFNHLLSWGEPFHALINHPWAMPYLEALLGPGFRLDHEYAHIIQQPGSGPIGSHLHGGGTPYDPCQYYHVQNGRMYNGLVAIAYHLTDVKPGEGGFGCIPGSHKSQFPLPSDWRTLEHPPECVREISGPAGTAIIFTEALTHGTLPWRGTGDRRTLFYKYSPRPSAWSRHYYTAEQFPSLTEEQRRLLKTPGIYP
ncbi:phytanoyl-CoA dioxygenase family protein [Leptolyngbya sp. AN02str]|uniref:phytanoyl-CoA dioxygenase family protein n=1 Tax=Leptolyngbya sp. AN02str TaxID=3423363 RepID=UPI003D31D09E